VLSGKVGAARLAGRVAMIGATAVGLHDQISTPLAALMPGVEKQATLIAALAEVRCALDMIDCLERLNARWLQRGEAPFDCGIGIDCGAVLVGNIGAEGRKMDYTVIGDHVNVASRVEGLTKRYPGALLVTDNVITALQAQTTDKPTGGGTAVVGEARVQGRAGVVTIYRCYRET